MTETKKTLPALSILRELLDYNPATGALIWRARIDNKVRAGLPAGCLTDRGYVRLSILGVSYLAHRVAWKMHHEQDPLGEIDHVNGNRSDNRAANLRIATTSQNHGNRVRKNSAIGLKGVTRDKKKYRAQLMVGKKNIYLGNFATPQDAHNAYLVKAREVFGEFACSGERST
jgi:hypothetical protein